MNFKEHFMTQDLLYSDTSNKTILLTNKLLSDLNDLFNNHGIKHTVDKKISAIILPTSEYNKIYTLIDDLQEMGYGITNSPLGELEAQRHIVFYENGDDMNTVDASRRSYFLYWNYWLYRREQELIDPNVYFNFRYPYVMLLYR